MAEYRLFFRESVEKDLRSLPAKDIERVLLRIKLLAENPRPAGSEKLAGTERYRLRQGNYRIVYSIQDKELTVWVVKIGHRKDVYR